VVCEENALEAVNVGEVSRGPLDLDATVVAVSHHVSCDLSGEAIVLDLDAGLYYGLNEVGARVWSLLQTPATVRSVLATLLDEYDVAPERCEQDLFGLIREFDERGLVQVREV
jgi:hypothetical protein